MEQYLFYMIFLLCLFVLLVFIYFFVKVDFIPVGRQLRALVDMMPGGLNKILNHLMCLALLFTSFYLTNNMQSFRKLFLVFLIFFSWLIIFTFSRQSALAYLFLLGAILFSVKDFKKFNVIVFFTISSFLFAYLFSLYQDSKIYLELVGRTIEQIDTSTGSASNRLGNYEIAFQSLANEMWGFGNQSFLQNYSIAPHSSIVGFIYAYGLFGLLLVSVFYIYCLYNIGIFVHKGFSHYSFVVLAFMLMPVFNDLLQSPLYVWSFFLSVRILLNKIEDSSKGIE